jgi:uncharacterized membrane protein YphA (DoxX/SURF4 family)
MMTEIQLVIRLAIGMVFAASAIGKLSSVDGFSEGIRAYKLLPPRVVRPAAITVIVVESILAISMPMRLAPGISSVVALLMIFIFMIVVGIRLRQGEKVPCYCFGRNSENISNKTLIRLFLLALGLSLLILPTKPRSVGAAQSELWFGLLWAGLLCVCSIWLLELLSLRDIVSPVLGRMTRASRSLRLAKGH